MVLFIDLLKHRATLYLAVYDKLSNAWQNTNGFEGLHSHSGKCVSSMDLTVLTMFYNSTKSTYSIQTCGNSSHQSDFFCHW